MATVENGLGLEPITIRLDMPALTTANALMPAMASDVQITLPTYTNDTCATNGEELFVAPVSIQSLISESTFGEYLGDTSSATVDSNIQNGDLISTTTTTAANATIAAPTKARKSIEVKSSLKRSTINYTHQKLILPNNKHIPLESLLASSESFTKSTVNKQTTRKKLSKPNVGAFKSAKFEKKKKLVPLMPMAPLASDGAANTENSPLLTTGSSDQTTTTTTTPPIVLPQHTTGVYLIAPSASVSVRPDLINSNAVKAGDKCTVTSVTAQPKSVLETGHDMHFVAMNYNFVEYMPLPSADNSPVKSDHHITLKS